MNKPLVAHAIFVHPGGYLRSTPHCTIALGAGSSLRQETAPNTGSHYFGREPRTSKSERWSLGGWAIAEKYRNTKAFLDNRGPLSLGRDDGHCLFSCTVTVRRRASPVLRRVRAQNLMSCGESFPVYFDPQYNCTMELLGFDSRQAHPRFKLLLDDLRRKIAQNPVLQPSNEVASSFLLDLPAYLPPFGRSSLSARVRLK